MNKSERILLKMDIKDDQSFIQLVEEIINSQIRLFSPSVVKIIKIDNWFDQKWLNYSGKSVVHFENTSHPERVALDNIWNEKINIPPFNPNRVIIEKSYRLDEQNEKLKDILLHKWQRSTDNKYRLITDITNNGLFLWYSSGSNANSRGCVMIYLVKDKLVDTWYADFKKSNDWQIVKTRNIDRKIIEKIMVGKG